MKLTKTGLFIFFTFSILSGPVSSGPFSEKLGECFVRSTTNSDKNQNDSRRCNCNSLK